MFSNILVWYLLVFAETFTVGLTSFTCDTYNPKKGSNAVCTCVSPNNIQWFVGITTLSTCSTTAVCLPLPGGYRFLTDNSYSDVKYQMKIQRYAYTNCAEYTCQNMATSAEEKITLSISDFDKNGIVALEPGANTDGQINITTGCVFPPDDIEITWYIVRTGAREEKFDANVSMERSACTNKCGSLEDKKVISGFTHTQYEKSDSVEVTYRVVVSHKSYTDPADIFNWTSAKYRIKEEQITTVVINTGQQSNNTGLIVSVTLGVLLVAVTLYAIIMTIYFKRKLILKDTETLTSESKKQSTYANLSYRTEDQTEAYSRPSYDDTTAVEAAYSRPSYDDTTAVEAYSRPSHDDTTGVETYSRPLYDDPTSAGGHSRPSNDDTTAAVGQDQDDYVQLYTDLVQDVNDENRTYDVIHKT